MLTAQRQDEPNRGKLNKDRSEYEEDARVLRERFWMIDPQRGNRGRKKQKRDNETLRRFRLRAAEDEERQAGDERGEDEYFNESRVFQAMNKLVAGAAAALLFGSESAAEKASAF